MKQALVLSLLLILLGGCSISESLNSNCGGDGRPFCDALFGTLDAEQSEDIKTNTARIEALSALELHYKDLRSQVNTLTLIQGQDATTLLGLITATQASANIALVQIATLQSEQRIVAVLDPCGDTEGFDEVILRTSNNQLLAYYESGKDRFLTMLGQGSYETTDDSECRFTVDSSGQICDEQNCY